MGKLRRLVCAGSTLLGTIVVLGLVPGIAHAYVFWSNETTNTIGRVTDDGDAATATQSFIANSNDAKGLAMDGTYLYWANFAGNSIGRAKLDGSDVNPNFITGASSPEGVAVSGNYLYWANGGALTAGTGSIGRDTLDGNRANRTESFITGASYPTGLTVDGTNIYWANYLGNGGSGSIGRAALDGSAANQNWLTVANPTGIVVYGGSIYWTDYLGGNIWRATLADSSSPVVVVSGASSPVQLTTDGSYLYWTNRYSMSVGRSTLAGGDPNQSFITASSAETWGVAVGLPPADAVPPSINGPTVGGQTLSASPGVWTQDPSTFTYQWLRCPGGGTGCTPVPGAVSATYTLGPADVGATLRVQAVASNLGGGRGPAAESGATSLIGAPAPLSSTRAPGVMGEAVQGHTLSAVHGAWSGSPATYQYRWLRCSAQRTHCAPIRGAVGATYGLSAADIGARLRVDEVAVDAYGDASSSASSATTGIVAPLPPRVTHVSVSGPTAVLTLACTGPRGQACSGTVVLSSHKRTRAGRLVGVTATKPAKPSKSRPGEVSVAKVNVGVAAFTIGAGTSAKLRVTLNSAGKALLAARYRLPASLGFTDHAAGPRILTFSYPAAAPAPDPGWVTWSWRDHPCDFCYTTVSLLRVPGLVPGATVTVECVGVGCPAPRTVRAGARSLDLTSVFRNRRLGPGAQVKLVIRARASVARIVIYTTRSGLSPTGKVLCQAPGERHPSVCVSG